MGVIFRYDSRGKLSEFRRKTREEFERSGSMEELVNWRDIGDDGAFDAGDEHQYFMDYHVHTMREDLRALPSKKFEVNLSFLFEAVVGDQELIVRHYWISIDDFMIEVSREAEWKGEKIVWMVENMHETMTSVVTSGTTDKGREFALWPSWKDFLLREETQKPDLMMKRLRF